MSNNQHTIAKEVSVNGVGLHSGKEVTMTFKPAPVNFGIKFQRIDLKGQPVVDADIDNVVDVIRGTNIEQNGVKINTVEHVLAALTGLEIDNILIELNSPEDRSEAAGSHLFYATTSHARADRIPRFDSVFRLESPLTIAEGLPDTRRGASRWAAWSVGRATCHRRASDINLRDLRGAKAGLGQPMGNQLCRAPGCGCCTRQRTTRSCDCSGSGRGLTALRMTATS